MSEEMIRPKPAREKFFDESIKPIIQNPIVADAFRRVDRGNFVPEGEDFPYSDIVISLEVGSSMSQPSLMAVMLDLLELSGSEKVMEVGTALGYNAALLSVCSSEVCTIELNEKLAQNARNKLQELGYTNVNVYTGDGAKGILEQAPFDRIILTAAAREFPQLLFEQLKDEGIIVGPIGDDTLRLAIGEKAGNTLRVKYCARVVFVSLHTQEHGGWDKEAQEKKRAYTLEESDVEVEYPEVRRDYLKDETDEEYDVEPTQECLDILAECGLTQQQFAQLWIKLGGTEPESRQLLIAPPQKY